MAFVTSRERAFQAGADETASQYLIVKLNSSGQYILSSAATDKHIGIAMEAPGSLDYGGVALFNAEGTLNVYAGGTIAIGDFLTANSSGQAVTTTTGGDQVIGQAIKAAVTGDLVEFIPFRIKYA